MPPRAPSSTYRIQLTPQFGFDDLAAVAGYLADLGVSHVYCSPYLQAAAGSMHGYDVVDHSRVNEELGGEEAHSRMLEALRAAGLGQVIDVVPNHMAVGTPRNRWWWDVLEHGRESRFAKYFDVDWDPPDAKLRETILVPILGDHYGRILEAGEIRLVEEEGELRAAYHDHRFPLAPLSMGAASLEEANADPDVLDAVLSRQHWRLAWWRTSSQELDYRRFFDIDSLVGVRVEDRDVFEASHERILGWVRSGDVDGLRIDHPDGLRDPAAYLQQLWDETGGSWIVVEKILETSERLPSTWPVAGTTGYDFMRVAGGLFVDPQGEEPLTKLAAELGIATDWEEAALAAKRQILATSLAGDVRRLVRRLVAVCERHRRHRDYTRADLSAAVVGVIESLGVYRTYVSDGRCSDEDRRVLESALRKARQAHPELDHELLSFIGDVLEGTVVGPAEEEFRERLQQLSGAVMAKAVEDTAFYRFPRLLALNEVGGDPSCFATSVEHFHSTPWAPGLLATSTHDTKRSEDVRARLYLLSEIPDAWAETVHRWSEITSRHKRQSPGGETWPDPATEHLLYQTIVGAYPISAERAVAYAEKAVREAKVHTSWTDTDAGYEEAVRAFVGGVLGDATFVADLDRFVSALVEPGRLNSLSLTLLRLTAPGSGTRIRAPRYGTSAWSTRTTGAPWTSSSGAACSPSWTAYSRPRSCAAATKVSQSCWSRLGPCGCAEGPSPPPTRRSCPGARWPSTWSPIAARSPVASW